MNKVSSTPLRLRSRILVYIKDIAIKNVIDTTKNSKNELLKEIIIQLKIRIYHQNLFISIEGKTSKKYILKNILSLLIMKTIKVYQLTENYAEMNWKD